MLLFVKEENMAEAAAGNKKVVFKWVWIAVVALIIIAGIMTPDWPGLSHEGKMAILLLVSAIVLWIVEALPLTATALGFVGLLPMLGVLPFNDTWKAMINGSMVMFIGIFAFTTFMMNATFPERLVAFIMKKTKGNSNMVVLGFMIIGCIISVCMSNIALTAVLMGLAEPLLRECNCKPGESNLGRCMSLAIPFAVMWGGCLLPSGTPINVLVLGLVEDNYGITITFLQWFGVTAIPSILGLFTTWFILIKVYKPEPISQEAVDATLAKVEAMPKMELKEIFNIAVIVITIILWILSSWFTILNTTAVVLIALFCMFLPGLSMMTIRDYRKNSPWEILLLMMAVNALVAALSANGASDWIVNVALGSMQALPFIALFIIASIFLAILHNVIPAGPALAALVCIPFCGLAAAVGGTGEIAIMAFVVAVWSALAFIIPLDSVLLVTYGYDYYKFGEMAKGGVPVTVAGLILFCIFLPIMCPLLGLV